MASAGNSTCARFDNVARVGAHYQQELPFLFVKGTWLPSEFTISICDGNDAWTGRATKDFVSKNARKLAMTESDYVDSIQYYFSKQQPNVRYELKWSKDSSPDLLCSKIMPHELILRLETIADSGPGVATDMVQFLLDAHYRINEELAKKTRTYERELAAKEVALTSLSKRLEQGKGSPTDRTNGHVPVEPDTALAIAGGTSSRGKRKAGTETGSRKRAQAVNTSEALPLYQRAAPIPVLQPYEEHALASRPPPLSALGYKQLKADERESSKEPSWFDKMKDPNDNGVTDDSNSAGQPLASRKAFLDRLSDVAVAHEDATPAAKKGSGKKQGKSGGKSSGKASKKPRPKPKISSEDSLDQVEEVVEKGITWADSVPPEPSSPLAAKRKTPATAKKQSKSSTKPKKQSSSRSKKKVKLVDSEAEASDDEPDESPDQRGSPVPDEDRAISVQNAEFHDFDESRSSETAFVVGQFWALYDDQDGMPRFYGRILNVLKTHPVQMDPNPLKKRNFQVVVEWLEPHKPIVPASSLVKSAKLSPACGEFTFGTQCTQDVPAFSHLVEVGTDANGAMVTFWPSEGELWALYRHWEKKQTKKEQDRVEDICYDYDLVKVLSKLSPTDGVTVVPLLKVEGFKSLFTVADLARSFNIPYKQIQGRDNVNSLLTATRHLLASSTPLPDVTMQNLVCNAIEDLADEILDMIVADMQLDMQDSDDEDADF